ncbi:MAG TPA: alginate export family protein [Vicinamibacterales bacterium]|nr:alginate export family protein [Vicinamibacterales bacterium]
MRAELRERMEGFDGAGFDAAREDLYWLHRLRLNAALTTSPHLAFHAQIQDARVARKTVRPTGAPFRAPFDLRLAYADIGSAGGPITIRAGRQELAYGEQRLLGHAGWLNAARAFDGVKATIRTRAFTLDLFGVSLVRTLVDAFDRSGNGNRVAGAYLTAPSLIPRGVIEPYVFWRRDVDLRTESGSPGDLGQATIGVRLAGTLPARLDYSAEMAIQRGSLGSDDLRTWAGHWRLRRSMPGPGALRLTGEYNYAAGDSNPTDGVHGTFDPLYPTPHDKYGLADQIGWRNLHHARAGVEFTPARGLPVAVNHHSWWLAERHDGLYTAGGALLARVAPGAARRHVGQEIDVQATHALTPQLQLAAGYAHILAGGFLDRATPGASYSHLYVMATYVFLAER